ncbi:hypothetical protein EZS27_029873 [termite gut metagenome]|jgi:hypothetical protein|uniref:Double-GTPase 1 domain-containing protein n=1 Tax=termite gut metagenome TaxID=433724 RepID=A0A5J4QFS3_9ZZZZ
MENNNILIIGGPNSGKTHFGGQLYLRFRSDEYNYKISTPPQDLTVFQEVVDCLSNGCSASRSNVDLHRNLSLEIIDSKNDVTFISFPDYGGEQVKRIVDNRRINALWQNQIENSDKWMFFIRLNDIPEIEDIVNRPLPEKVSVKDKGKLPFKLSDHAFYIELLQMLLYAKKVSNKQNIVIPRLMIVLSCWDLLNAEGTTPSEILKSKLPMFYEFITNSWDKNNLYIVGLSSTEKTLDSKIPDNDYLDKNPENFGYAILPDGTKEKDLTTLISKIIGQ